MQVDSFLTCTVLYLDNCYFKKDFFYFNNNINNLSVVARI